MTEGHPRNDLVLEFHGHMLRYVMVMGIAIQRGFELHECLPVVLAGDASEQ